jgi:hypothetical protein
MTARPAVAGALVGNPPPLGWAGYQPTALPFFRKSDAPARGSGAGVREPRHGPATRDERSLPGAGDYIWAALG